MLCCMCPGVPQSAMTCSTKMSIKNYLLVDVELIVFISLQAARLVTDIVWGVQITMIQAFQRRF